MATIVQRTPELYRILSLPRRVWDGSALAGPLSDALRRPGGSMMLRPIQAAALYECYEYRGVFLPVRVGGGKTLISLLAPLVMNSKRPLLLVPAKLKEKTRREMIEYGRHFRIPNFVRVETYELLGRPQAADMLESYQPDLIICDEIHKLKNPRAACTKRVRRHMAKHLTTRMVGLSGTITKNSIKDYAHLLAWCLGPAGAPLPQGFSELRDWSDVIDADGTAEDPGALRELVNNSVIVSFPGGRASGGNTMIDRVRMAYRDRLVSTPGVIASDETPIDASLQISFWRVPPPPEVTAAMHTLRTKWETPDGWPLEDAISVRRVMRELAMGFYYVWDPRPPENWIRARRAWHCACRTILATNRRNLDSAKQVSNAIDAGHYPEHAPALQEWRAIEPTFEPSSKPIWLSDFAVNAAREWATDGGIIWVEHIAVGEAIWRAHNIPYYGAKGMCGQYFIEDHAKLFGGALVASIKSNAEGRNLQHDYSRNLILSPPANALEWEQLLGRTHRDGQKADEVTCDILTTCDEHLEAFEKARTQAVYRQQTTGSPEKLLLADMV